MNRHNSQKYIGGIMKTYFTKQQKYSTWLSGWFKGAGMLLLIGVFCFLFGKVGLAAPPLPPLPLPPPIILPPPPLPPPPVFIPPPPGPPPHPGWYWVPGRHRGHHRVEGYWARPDRDHRYHRRYYHPGPPHP
jgi:hypothetical protein